MKKVFFILAVAISIMLPNRSFSQIDMGTAFSIIKANVFNDDVSNYHITALPNAIPPQTQIVTMDSIVVSPNFTSWFFCADDNPYILSGETSHCIFIFVDASSGLITQKSNCAKPIDSTLIVLNKTNSYDPNFIFNVPITYTPNTPPLQHNYAIIINGGESRLQNFSWFWNDCSVIFKILKNKYHYDQNKIYVLMSDGTSNNIDIFSPDLGTLYRTSPLDLDGDGVNDIKYPAKKASISAIFDTLAQKITPIDNVFIYVTDHGGENSTIDTWADLDSIHMGLTYYESFTKAEFMNEIDKLSAAKTINIVMNQCYSGGYASSLSYNNCVISTACSGTEQTREHFIGTYSEFTYYWACAILGYTPDNIIINADSNADGHISMQEAFKFAGPNTNRKHEHPQFNGSTSGLGSYLTLEGSYGPMFQHPYNYDLYIKDHKLNSIINMGNPIFRGNSPDIWVRRFNDGCTTHQDPIRGDTNYVYVRVHNSGSTKSPGVVDTLRIYLKNNGRNIDYGIWDSDWDIAATTIVPPIRSLGDTILKLKVFFPSNTLWPNFTILARINSDLDQMNEYPSTLRNITANNNISAKNITTVRMNYAAVAQQSVAQVYSPSIPNIGNKLHFECEEPDEESLLTDEAEIHVVLSEDFVNNLMDDATFNGMSRINDSTFLITSPSSSIEGFSISESVDMTAKVNINFITRRSSEKGMFSYNVFLENDEELYGAISIQAMKPERTTLFQANAGSDIVITPNSDVIFEAVDILEDAVYKWYSLDGQLLHIGRVFDTNLSNAGQYVLEVTALSDGFKDYDTVKVIMNPNIITSITPNPVSTGNITVCFTLDNSVNEAKLYIYSSPSGTLQGTCNILNTETYKIIDVSSYTQGSYLLVLVCDGVNTDSKLFVKQ